MNKLLTALILSATALTAQAGDFQQVYEVPGKTAAQITQAANIKAPKAHITCYSWGVSLPFVADIIVEAKDGRYRLTFDNMRSLDSGASLASLPQTQESCGKAMAQYGNELNKKIANWSDF